MQPKRAYYKAEIGRGNSEDGITHDRHEVAVEANVISSLADDGLHYPVLDIDFTAYTVPSTTPGHCHLYLDRGLSWEQYEKLLSALADAGIIEEGYAKASIYRQATFVRLPTVSKPAPEVAA